jgi:secreted trypsin-like serine protease
MKKQIWMLVLALISSGIISLGARAESDFHTLIENGITVPSSGALSDSEALLTYGNGAFCSATFLSPRTLITAGHCAAASITVSIMKPGGGFYAVRSMRVIRHPNFQNYKDRYGMTIIKNDMTIIQLAQPFPTPVRTVTLAQFPAGQWAQVTDVGYGFRRLNSGAKVLRWGTMQGHLETIGQFGDRVGLEQRNSNNQNVCPGDSGGAVLLGDQNSRYLVAVHSLANGCTQGRSTGASSELVWPAQAWIKSLTI